MITYRFVTNGDIPHIQTIAHDTWMFTYGDIYSKDYIHNFLSVAYSTENLSRSVERDLQSSKRKFLTAEYNNVIVGFAQTTQVHEEEYELIRIYIRPEYHKLGIGTGFIQRYIQVLAPIKHLFAWVAKDNDIGRVFYEKCGFKETEEKVEIIGGNTKKQLKYELEL
ncbi:GNAT family N-acetyltransferase [Paenibacillus sp. ACRRY]|uniref:GNAT family N-acetyltransferase n=1 Tax=Paenibacillus sp. ACRRY TaxID=2918208 RepID=UPI001EF6CF50|nr:GNAT family N-acetyltransferase [Paenibacillus sp. ACRRY]MCG7382420.1 GNAT family N-acetyltransferase [Paenibacillus sp. ACRRY]